MADKMKKSTQVALGGLCAALCLLLMFLSGLIPFSSYVFPAMAGIVLIVVAEENGKKTALLTYLAVAALSLLIVPDQEAKLLFIMLLGYYPMLKQVIEKFSKLLAYLIKFVLINGVVVLFYYTTLYILGIPNLLEGWGELGRYTIYVAFAMVNFTFFMYDFLLTQITWIYRGWFRPKILRKIL